MRFEIKQYGSSPLDIATFKAYAKIDVSSDDTVIQLILDSVVSYAERMTHRELRGNVWTGYADDFCDLTLRKNRVESIGYVKYIREGEVVTVDESIYYLNRRTLYSIVELTEGSSWPDDIDAIPNSVEVEFATAPDMRLPEIKLAMLRHAVNAYENRGDELVGVYYSAESIDFYKKISIPNI